jgi:hypothetical protein
MTGGGRHDPIWLTADEHRTLTAALDLVVGGAGAAGGADYVDQLLGAFEFDPPRIWAGGPYSGRHGGEAGFDRWLELGTAEELAWRTRIEGSAGRPEREFNGAVRGWQESYREGLAALSPDFDDLDDEAARRRLDSAPAEFRDLLFAHACESLYGDPVYGGNRDGVGWRSIGFTGDVQPAGWNDHEVSLGGPRARREP